MFASSAAVPLFGLLSSSSQCEKVSPLFAMERIPGDTLDALVTPSHFPYVFVQMPQNP
jgi:hypothetical protein